MGFCVTNLNLPKRLALPRNLNLSPLLGGAGIPSWVKALGPILPDEVANWTTNQVWRKGQSGLVTLAAFGIVTSRSGVSTNLLPSSPPGFAYSTFPANTLVQWSGGRAAFKAVTNLFVNPTAPVTQTIALPATGTYTLWGNWPVTGSAVVAAGTATITGAGSVVNGSPLTINCTATGTITVTLSGSPPQAFQVEAGDFGTRFAPSGPVGQDVITRTWVPGPAYSVYEQCTVYAKTTDVAQTIIYAGDGGDNNRFIVQRDNTGTPVFVAVTGGTLQFFTNFASVWAQGASGNMAASVTSGAQNAAFGGTLAATQTSVTLPTVSVYQCGGDQTGSSENGVATITAWWKQAIPNTQLQSLTT